MRMPVVLTISTSDATGRGGIQADLRALAALGVHGTTVITAVRARGPDGPGVLHEIPSSVVREQLQAALRELPPQAVKIAAGGSTPVIRVIAQELRREAMPLVVDPWLAGRSGLRPIRTTTLNSLINELLPLATLLTPNLPEASLLAGFPIRSENDAKRAGRMIQNLGPRAVLIKGGHSEGPEIVDGLLDGRTWHLYRHARLDTPRTAGAGHVLSAAIAGWLARGETLPEAVGEGLEAAHRWLLAGQGPGAASGPTGPRASGG